jgi:DNA repair protein RecO (recombination protein O)
LELFTRVNVIFFQKTDHLQTGGTEHHPLLRITQVDVVEMFPQLTSDFHKLIGASYIAEFLNKVFEPYDASHKSVYTLVHHTLHALAISQNVRNILPAFEIKLLAHLGYTPVLQRCIGCQKTNLLEKSQSPASEALLGFDFSTGGVLCQQCKRLKKSAFDLSPQAIETLQQLLETKMRHVERITLSPKIHQELKHVLMGYIQYHLGLSLKTESFVQKLRTAKLSP